MRHGKHATNSSHHDRDRNDWNDRDHNHRTNREDDTSNLNASTDTVSRNLGAGDDTVNVSGNAATQVRLTFTSAEVGNGNPRDAGTLANQDGGLAVRVQTEDAAGNLAGPVSRFDDEGITFEARGGVTFDVRDLVTGAARGDQFDEVSLGTQAADKFDERGSNEAYYINAGMGADSLIGGNRADFLVGGAGDDSLNGTFGNDSYIGGGGRDAFVFDTALGQNNVDRILDFNAADDVVRLDTDVFKGLSAGELAPGAFATGTAAMQADDRIIFNTATGQAFFDADGSGAGAQVQFATLLATAPGATTPTAATGVTAADFAVYADDDRGQGGRDRDRGDGKHKDRDDHDQGKDKWDHGKHGGNDRDYGKDNDVGRSGKHVLKDVFGKDVVKSADQYYAVDLDALNNSKVSGGALFAYDQDSGKLSVAISAQGLEPNQPHAQHIHGFLGDSPQDAMVPGLAEDADRDGFVELAEGLVQYGPILLSLTDQDARQMTDGSGDDHGGHGGGAFPTAPDGNIFFVETYQLPTPANASDEGLSIPPDLTLREIVLHGQSVAEGSGKGTPGEVDGTPGYKAVLPVASGTIENLDSPEGRLALVQFQNALDGQQQHAHHDMAMV